MEIKVKGSSMVCPAEDIPKRSLWVSNLDLLVTPAYHVHFVSFYKPNECSDFFDSIMLKYSLCKILVPFYPVAGRLQYDQNGRIEVACNGEGVLFVEAETPCVMDDIVGDYSDEWNSSRLLPTIDYSGGISSFPLLALQVTRFKCGGVCLGVAFQHTLMDGPAVVHFFNGWADMARGLPLTIEPFFDRIHLRARVPPTPSFSHVEFHPSPTCAESQAKPSILSIVNITAEQLNTMKAKMKGTTKCSPYCILTAHLWRCATKARGLKDDQAVKLIMPVDGRTRLQPNLPVGYFGNVIFDAALVALAGELQSEPFTDTIKRIKEALERMDNEYMRSNIDYLETVSDIESIMQGPETTRCPNLSVNSWARFPFYNMDFGWGCPVYVRPVNLFEGEILILPSSTNNGSLSIVACLETSHVKSFEKLLHATGACRL